MTSQQVVLLIIQELKEQGYSTAQSIASQNFIIVFNDQRYTKLYVPNDQPHIIYTDCDISTICSEIDLTEPNSVGLLLSTIQERIGAPKRTKNHDIKRNTTNNSTGIR